MSAPALNAVPPTLKSGILKYLRVASEHDKRDPVIAYYCRLYAMQHGMTIDKKSPDARQFLVSLMDFLEQTKGAMKDEEAVHNEVCGQAHVENYALKLFLYADNEDRAGNFGKNVIKAFLTSSLLLDVLTTFGELNEDLEKNRKYAKWKALYINKCLQNGETPMAGPMPEEGEEASLGVPPPPTGGLGFEGVSGPQYPTVTPPSNMTDSGLFPTPGAHAPPSTPQEPPRGSDYPTPPPVNPAAAARLQPDPRTSAAAAPATDWTPPPNPGGVKLTSAQFQKGMKYCKFASSAMQYEDSQTAIENLTKALKLLTTGADS